MLSSLKETALWGGKDEIIEKIKKNAAKLIDFTDGATEEHLYSEIKRLERVIDAIQEIRLLTRTGSSS